MEYEEIVSKVKGIIVDKLGVEPSEVTETANFTNDLGADSLDTVELLMEFEKVFGIKIPDEETSAISTVKDAIDKSPKSSLHKPAPKTEHSKDAPPGASFFLCPIRWYSIPWSLATVMYLRDRKM